MKGEKNEPILGLFERLTILRDGLGSSETNAARDRAEEEAIPPSPLLDNPDALLTVLIEHASDPDQLNGQAIVGQPIRVLQVRAHLLEHEAKAVLDVLSAKKLIERIGDWESARVLQFVRGTQRDEQIIDLPRSVSHPLSRSSKSMSPRPKAVPTLKANEPEKIVEPESRTKKAHEILKARSIVVDGIVVRGPVLLLQVGFRITSDEAMGILEELRSQNQIEQIDGWRSIRLLPEPVMAAMTLTEPDPVVDVLEPEKIVKIASLRGKRAYELLMARSVMADGKRIVRGAVPALNVGLRLTAKEIVRILEELRDQNHIEQIDGWRTVRLLSETAQVAEVVENQVSPVTRVAKEAVRTRPPAVTRTRAKPVTPVESPPAAGSQMVPVAEAIEAVQNLLPQLQQTRDKITGCVAQLESALVKLKAVQDKPAVQQQLEAGETVRQIIATNEVLREMLG